MARPSRSTPRPSSHAQRDCAATSAWAGRAPCSPASCSAGLTISRRRCAATTARGDLMDPNKLTQKTAEALHAAQTRALRYGHTEVDVEHLLAALLEQPGGLIPRLLVRLDADVDAIEGELERHLEARPRVTGSGASGEA